MDIFSFIDLKGTTFILSPKKGIIIKEIMSANCMLFNLLLEGNYWRLLNMSFMKNTSYTKCGIE